MKRIRTIPKAVQEIKEADPGTCLTAAALRHWIKQGKLPAVYKGAHALIDLDELEAYLEGRR